MRNPAEQGRARGEFEKNPWVHGINIYRNSILLNSAKVQYLSKDT
jgi:hypothetical protein